MLKVFVIWGVAMKFCLYKMTYDTGFAPNPYGEYLTLATCTPNHQRAHVQVGDWIIGVESDKLAQERISAGCNTDIKRSFIYAAKVTEIMDLDSYFRDPRFEYKKPKPDSPKYEERRGDNIYYRENGVWKWVRGHDHEDKYEDIVKDIKGNIVFISNEFIYLGDKGIEVPKEIEKIFEEKGSRGVRYCRESDSSFMAIREFIECLIKVFGYGKHGCPICYCIRRKLNRETYCK